MSNEVRPPIDIGGASKSRPGPLDPDENRPRPVPQSSIQRSGGSGGGTSWMPAIIAIVVSVIASAVMVFMFNPAKAGVDTLSNQVIQLDQRMSTMEGYATKIDKIDDIDTSLNQLLATSAGYVTQSDLAGITNGMATGDDVATLQASIDALTTANNDLASRITELETVKEEEEEATLSENTIRWRFEEPALLLSNGSYLDIPSDISIFIDPDSSRMEEEDLYYADIYISNDGTTTAWEFPSNFMIEVVLKPRSSTSYALLSEDTFLDTEDTPDTLNTVPSRFSSPSWDADFETRTREGNEVTKKVIFTSNRLPAITIEHNGYLDIPIVLELYYE